MACEKSASPVNGDDTTPYTPRPAFDRPVSRGRDPGARRKASVTRRASARLASPALSKIVTSNGVSGTKGAPSVPRAAASASVTAPRAGSTSQRAGRRFAARLQPCAHRRRPTSAGMARKMPPARIVGNTSPRIPSRVTTEAAAPDQLLRRARQDVRGDGVTCQHGLLNDVGEAGHERTLKAAIVDRVNQFATVWPDASRRERARSGCVAGPRPSNWRTTADNAARPIQKPPPSSPSRYPQPPARHARRAASTPYAIDPVPATITTPG